MAKKYTQMAKVLKRLLLDRNMKSIDLAREVNLPPPTIHRLVTGKSTRPYKSSVEPIADFFSISSAQLLGEEPLPGEEKIIGDETTELSTKRILQIPLIPWNNVTKVNLSDTEEKEQLETIPFVGKISDKSFATIMPDSSMDPVFSKNSLLIFDPSKTVKDRGYILVYLAEAKITVFRQLLIDSEYKYLKPLNPDLNTFKMRLLGEEDKILAVLIEARQVYDDDI